MFITEKALLTVTVTVGKINARSLPMDIKHPFFFFSFLPLFCYKSCWSVGLLGVREAAVGI